MPKHTPTHMYTHTRAHTHSALAKEQHIIGKSYTIFIVQITITFSTLWLVTLSTKEVLLCFNSQTGKRKKCTKNIRNVSIKKKLDIVETCLDFHYWIVNIFSLQSCRVSDLSRAPSITASNRFLEVWNKFDQLTEKKRKPPWYFINLVHRLSWQ